MKNNFGLIKRLGILAFLLVCLGFVTFMPNTTRTALAAPCCSDCPLPPSQAEPTPSEFCADYCGARSGSCYNSCLSDVYSCWQICSMSCSGDGGCGRSCTNDLGCLGGGSSCTFCIQGHCT
jgi:hypothetical protein